MLHSSVATESAAPLEASFPPGLAVAEGFSVVDEFVLLATWLSDSGPEGEDGKVGIAEVTLSVVDGAAVVVTGAFDSSDFAVVDGAAVDSATLTVEGAVVASDVGACDAVVVSVAPELNSAASVDAVLEVGSLDGSPSWACTEALSSRQRHDTRATTTPLETTMFGGGGGGSSRNRRDH
uniref:Putative mucin n=1 Tax=Ixodes ricinus TaxID=34613 RepID=A0A0K8RL34_IXORI